MAREAESKRLYDEGLKAFREGDQDTARRLNEQALELARAQSDELNQVRALVGLARVAFRDADHARLRELCDAATPMFERLEDPTLVTSPLHMLAESARMEGKFDTARALYARSIELARNTDDELMLETEMVNMALLELAAGKPARALALGRETLAMAKDNMARIYCFLAIGAALVAIGETEQGVETLAATKKMLDQASVVLDPADQPVFDRAIADARRSLRDEGYEKAWQRGLQLSTQEAVARIGS